MDRWCHSARGLRALCEFFSSGALQLVQGRTVRRIISTRPHEHELRKLRLALSPWTSGDDILAVHRVSRAAVGVQLI